MTMKSMMKLQTSVEIAAVIALGVLLSLIGDRPQLMVAASTNGESSRSQRRSTAIKIDCHPDPNANESECQRRNCFWQKSEEHSSSGQPSCFFPAEFNCFDFKSIGQEEQQAVNYSASTTNNELSDDGEKIGPIDGYDRNPRQATASAAVAFRWQLTRKPSCPASGFPDDAERLQVELSVYGDSFINIKISEPDRQRFAPSLPEINLPKKKAKAGGKRMVYAHDGIEGRKVAFGQLLVELPTKHSGVLKVIHLVSGAVLFETDFGKLIYSRQFIQLPTYLPSRFIYGLGQHMGKSLLKSAANGERYAKSYTMFNYGHPPQLDDGGGGRAAYSSYPFYINLAQLHHHDHLVNTTKERNFEQLRRLIATGALMLNSNAMDVLVHSPSSSSVGSEDSGSGGGGGSEDESDKESARSAGLTWRLVGGIIDLYLFAGPTPHDVVDQYQSLVGRPTLPPAWSLGYHQSRLNYRDLLAIKLAWARTRSAGIPMESIWTDLDFLWRGTSYTLNNPELNELVKILQTEFDMHYVPIVDPAISVREELETYEPLKLAKSMDLFAAYLPKDGLGGESSTAVVTTWTESTKSALLDFTHPLIVRYLRQILGDYKRISNFDGVWLDMNEPEVFANEEDENGRVCPFDEEPLYLPGGRKLQDRTMCMAAEFYEGKHYDLHNLYAFYQSKAHYEALKLLNPSKRPFILSRSQFVGQGKYSGSWLGDLGSTFEYLRWSVLGTIESNWFGQPLVGADICGFFGATSDELCARWFSLGAFYPFARNHNDGTALNQDPGALGEIVQRAARLAFMRRYSLLPYLYTLFHENHLNGQPVVRSVLFEFFDRFYTNINLEELPQIDDQFMWGPAMMIAPVLKSNSQSRSVYLSPGRWYDISIGLPGTNMDEGPYEALKSNWPANQNNGSLSDFARKRVNDLHKPIDCNSNTGCWLSDRYTPLGAINIYLRGGQIVPTFKNVHHTDSVGVNWKKASFFLEIALDQSRSAVGSLYWDNGESKPEAAEYSYAHFWASSNRLSVILVKDDHEEPLTFSGFLVYGVKPTGLLYNREPTLYRGAKLVYNYNNDTGTLSCLFMSPSGTETKPLELKRYDKLAFKWA